MNEVDRLEIFKKSANFLKDYPRIRGILVKPNDKVPVELNWQKANNYPVTSTHILNYIILHGGNAGLMHPAGMSVGIDDDNELIRKAVLSLGDTFSYNTGKPGHYCDIFIIKDEPVGNIPLIDGAYIRGIGGQNLAPGSIHPNGNVYGRTYLNLVPPLAITKAELLEAFNPYIVGKEKLIKNSKTTQDKIKIPLNPDSLTMRDLVDVNGFKEIKEHVYQGTHPIHGSTTGTNFVVNFDSNEWICFRHNTGGSVIQWLAVATGVIKCEESVPGKIKGKLFWETMERSHNELGISMEKLAKIGWE